MEKLLKIKQAILVNENQLQNIYSFLTDINQQMTNIQTLKVENSIVSNYNVNQEDALDVAVAKFVSKTGLVDIERLQQGRYTLNG